MMPYVLIWGGGDLATGVALRLHHVGIRVLIVEKDQPLAVRRSVAFAEAVYAGNVQIEDVSGELILSPEGSLASWQNGRIPVIIDPELSLCEDFPPLALVDARMRKRREELVMTSIPLLIGLGPGFTVGDNCDAAVETNRGHFLGRVYWSGSPEVDTGVPGKVAAYASERVLHAPTEGVVEAFVEIGDLVQSGQPILSVAGENVVSPFAGVVRGLIHSGVKVRKNMKVGDIDPRPEVFRCWTVSEKALAIGGGVLEALLTRPEVRGQLWQA